MRRVVIIGGGLAGLGAAWHLQRRARREPVEYVILEKEDRPGGLARTERAGEFLFDYTGHLLHFGTARFRELVFHLIGDRLTRRDRSAWIYSQGVYTRYPFQANLFGLPSDTIVECLYGAARAHFDGARREIHTFDDWIEAHFGKGIADHFMVPYNSKLYRRHPREMSPDCAGRFAPRLDLRQLLRGAVAEGSASLGYNSVFYYPAAGGIETLVRALVGRLGPVSTSEPAVEVDPDAGVVATAAGREIAYDALISTQPIPGLVRSLRGAPDDVRAAAAALRHVSVLNINLGIKGDVGDRHWVYVPQPDIAFHRVGFPHNFADAMVPAGCGSVYLEVTYAPETGIDIAATRRTAVEGLMAMGILRSAGDVVVEKTIDIPHGYVVFDKTREKSLGVIHAWLRSRRIFSAGRFGSWGYTSMEDSFLEGRRAASNALRSS
jgi:protoporphyrinogen oxidase